jgi:methylated-DNA-[protein]-cysteine S-methyltransferase
MIYICESNGTITNIGFTDTGVRENITPPIKETMKQLNEYFSGKRKEFDLPLSVEGSELQKDVCNSLMKIPYGETRTYADIAKDVGRPRAVRAVATAIGKNPIAIVIPCHRVIGSDGKMRGFAGGIPFKEYLLKVEGWKPRKK